MTQGLCLNTAVRLTADAFLPECAPPFVCMQSPCSCAAVVSRACFSQGCARQYILESLTWLSLQSGVYACLTLGHSEDEVSAPFFRTLHRCFCLSEVLSTRQDIQ